MSVNYIICAAGEGSRLQQLGSTSKASIKLGGRTLLRWSLDSLPIMHKDSIIIIGQKKHNLMDSFQYELNQRYPFNRIRFVEIDYLTKGQLDTVVCAESECDLDSSLAVYNCDTYFQSSSLLSLMNDPSIEGIIPCSKEPGDAWSFCQVDQKMDVTKVAEKERISEHASVGFYYFRNTKNFFERAHQYIDNYKENRELYVAPFYDIYLAKGERVVVDSVEFFRPMGSFEQILDYWNIGMDELILENSKGVLVVDLDNTITIEEKLVSYPEKKPNKILIEKLWLYKKNGFKIIISTARRMKTCSNDEASVIANIGEVTMAWLKKHNVPFDGIKFGKPFAENGFYIDDKSIRPDEFVDQSYEELIELIGLKEFS